MTPQKYKEYWDKWHSEWWTRVNINWNNQNAVADNIEGWEIPDFEEDIDGRINQKNWKYFPEPYWGNPVSNELKAVFLNINPGPASSFQYLQQTYISKDSSNKETQRAELYNKYCNEASSYYATVQHLLNLREYDTTAWMIKNRVKWLKDGFNDKKLNIHDIFCADLIPWHTRKSDVIKDYVIQHKQQIINKVIEPLCKISDKITPINEEENYSLKNKVIVRGSYFIDIVNFLQLKLEHVQYHSVRNNNPVNKIKPILQKMSSDLIEFTLFNTRFFVFSRGSQNMMLSNLNYNVITFGEHRTQTLRDLLFSQQNF